MQLMCPPILSSFSVVPGCWRSGMLLYEIIFSDAARKTKFCHTQDKTDRGLFETLPGHEGLVTCIQFIRDNSFVSADDRGALRFWRKFGSQACMYIIYCTHI